MSFQRKWLGSGWGSGACPYLCQRPLSVWKGVRGTHCHWLSVVTLFITSHLPRCPRRSTSLILNKMNISSTSRRAQRMIKRHTDIPGPRSWQSTQAEGLTLSSLDDRLTPSLHHPISPSLVEMSQKAGSGGSGFGPSLLSHLAGLLV